MNEPLTPAMLKTLRTADSVTCRLDVDPSGQPVHLLQTTSSVWLDDLPCLPRADLPVGGRVIDYHPQGSDQTAYRGSAELYAGSNSSWATVAAALRAGDNLTLSWFAGREVQTVGETVYYRDDLSLEVARGEQVLRFLLDVTFSPDNMTRMIRYRPRAASHSSPRRRDVATYATQLQAALPARCPKRLTLLVSHLLADELPETLTVAGSTVTVVVDEQRQRDEAVVTDIRMRRLVAHAFILPPNVHAAGADAQVAYRRLREGGMLPTRAADVAIAIGLPAAA